MCVDKKPQLVIQFVGLAYQLCGQAQTFASKLALLPLESLPLVDLQEAVTIEILREHYLTLVQLLSQLQLCNAVEAGHLLQGVGQWKNKFENGVLLIDPIADSYKQLGLDLSRLSCAMVMPGSLAEKMMEFLLTMEESSGSRETLELPSGLHCSLNNEGRNGLIDIECCDWKRWVEFPVNHGKVYENSVLSRVEIHSEWENFRTGLPLVDRVRAKWLDSAVFWQSLGSDKKECNPPVFGVNQSGTICQSWVETARGRLYHLAHVESDRVMDYAICAPTEWNFHPEGVAKKLLKGLSNQVSDSVRWAECASLYAQVIDPCVPVRFVV
ncbi:hypothetical protein [Hydrogenovibrio marinus]|uniref:Uncharacterized protein n=1 Tax=Hydrogenovibrio marinus TaxID=28885 RepID=A0A066ZWN2_HYDMR|nr:hypothetical protein [Hydrogenovibrio marinus]KDN94751.1 hypothetical protein EI16_00060 [Hydrogenovibrio marinus]BBN59207.1 hypothetical protein HVMH_0801 [Hydrogenovibrio marinus]